MNITKETKRLNSRVTRDKQKTFRLVLKNLTSVEKLKIKKVDQIE